MPCAKCVELERQLKKAWEDILKMDDEIQRISELIRQIEQPNAPEARSL